MLNLANVYIRGIKDSRVPLATKVGDAVGDANITKLWQDHFSALLNSMQNEGSKPFVCESIDRDMHNEDNIVITAPGVCECLKTIKLGKAAGLDNDNDNDNEMILLRHKNIKIML